MRALSIGLIALFFFKSNAQVKEINFLGKEWYLHGYDFRFGYISHSLDYGSDMLRNRSSIDTDNIDMNFVTVHEIITGDNPVKNITFGLVFRPYQRSHLNLLRQLEIGHSLGLRWFNNKINVKNLAGQTFTNGKYKGSFIDYSPSITISSKPIVNQFKFYFTGRAETAVPLSNALELSSVDSSLMTNGNLKRTFQTNHLKLNYGFMVGVKINIDCNWNMHLEGGPAFSHLYFGSTKNWERGSTGSFKIGFRYKFGAPSEEGSDTTDGTSLPVFW